MVKKRRPEEGRTIFSPGEACYYLGLSWNTLKKLIAEGDIRAVKVGKRKILIPKESIDNYMNRDNLMAKAFLKSIKQT